MIRILVTGSRDLPERYEKSVWTKLAKELAGMYGHGDDQAVIVEGGCTTGADRYARSFVNQLKRNPTTELLTIHSETHLANWRGKGRAAGPQRNQDMADLGADLCIAFYYQFTDKTKNRGTRDMVEKAKKAGINVEEVFYV